MWNNACSCSQSHGRGKESSRASGLSEKTSAKSLPPRVTSSLLFEAAQPRPVPQSCTFLTTSSLLSSTKTMTTAARRLFSHLWAHDMAGTTPSLTTERSWCRDGGAAHETAVQTRAMLRIPGLSSLAQAGGMGEASSKRALRLDVPCLGCLLCLGARVPYIAACMANTRETTKQNCAHTTVSAPAPTLPPPPTVRAWSDRRTDPGLLTFSSDLRPPFVRPAEFGPLQVGQKSDSREGWDGR